MYIRDGIAYASEASDDIRIVSFRQLPYEMLLLTFSTGEERLFDLTTLTGPAFEPLKEKSVQDSIQLCHGYITWQGGDIDCAPEYMYENSYEYSQPIAV